MTEQHDQWQALAVRRPDDVPTITPLSWMAEKQRGHAERVSNNALPSNFPYDLERGDAGDALAVLALGEAIRRDVEHGRGSRVHEALTLGATPDEARELLREWAADQRHLYAGDVERSAVQPLGLDDDAHVAVLALCALGDDQPTPAVAVGTEAR